MGIAGKAVEVVRHHHDDLMHEDESGEVVAEMSAIA